MDCACTWSCVHMVGACTWSVRAHGLCVHMDCACTWTVRAHGLCVHMDCACTWTVRAHGRCVHMDCACTWSVRAHGRCRHGRYMHMVAFGRQSADLPKLLFTVLYRNIMGSRRDIETKACNLEQLQQVSQCQNTSETSRHQEQIRVPLQYRSSGVNPSAHEHMSTLQGGRGV